MDDLFSSIEETILSVQQVNALVNRLISESFPSLWIRGEISNLSRPQSGHMYFTLKDAHAQIRAAIWRSAARRLKTDLAVGLHVRARGRLGVYEARGDYQFQVEEIIPEGVGPLEVAYQKLKEDLFALGYFDPARKKPIPNFPRTLAVITSPSGAAIRDILETLVARWPVARVVVVPVRVQGPGAAEEIAGALRRLHRALDTRQLPIDLVILGRGGGSLEDLWAFNERIVADAIFDSRIPVLSGIGHEIDETIADLVADRRCLTPTDAAMQAVPRLADSLESLDFLLDRLTGSLRRAIDFHRDRLQRLRMRPVFRRPLDRLRAQEQRLDDLFGRVQRAMQGRFTLAENRVRALARNLEGVSPLATLQRGYSLTLNDRRQLLRSVEELRPGDVIVTRLRDGACTSRIEQVEPAPKPRGRP